MIASLCIPFEGLPHQATWMAWPFDDSDNGWAGFLQPARQEYARLVEAVAQCEQVELLYNDAESLESARGLLQSWQNVRAHQLPLNDVWLRDSGPMFAHGPAGLVGLVHQFNAWGGKYPHQNDSQVGQKICSLSEPALTAVRSTSLTIEGGAFEFDGQGHCLTTVPCLMGPTRNPGLTQQQLESALGDHLGVSRWTWLEHGLIGDHTDGHIDTLARFVDPGTVLACSAPPSDPNHPGLLANRQRLEEAGLRVIDLPIPSQVREIRENRVPESYANYYFVNGKILLPQYGDSNDSLAVQIVSQAFPDKEVVPLSSRWIITGGGSFHCLTQQQPR